MQTVEGNEVVVGSVYGNNARIEIKAGWTYYRYYARGHGNYAKLYMTAESAIEQRDKDKKAPAWMNSQGIFRVNQSTTLASYLSHCANIPSNKIEVSKTESSVNIVWVNKENTLSKAKISGKFYELTEDDLVDVIEEMKRS